MVCRYVRVAVGEGWVGVEHEHDGHHGEGASELPEYDAERYEHDRHEHEEDDGGYEGDEYGQHDYGYGYEDDGGFSDVLADAILKRPESIRVRSRPKQREREPDRDKPPTEFTFPSLTDFGPGVHQSGGGYADKQQEEEGSVGAGAVQPEAIGAGAEESLAEPVPPLENSNDGSSSEPVEQESQS